MSSSLTQHGFVHILLLHPFSFTRRWVAECTDRESAGHCKIKGNTVQGAANTVMTPLVAWQPACVLTITAA